MEEPLKHPNDPLFMAKLTADVTAEEHAKISRQMVMRMYPPPMGQLHAASIMPNYRYFRRMAGLRGADTKRDR